MEISPYTDGASEWPIAEMCYPIGDDSTNTEIRVVVGMPVWVAFRGGDERYPIIIGHRPVNTGNEQSTRRWDHDNIELNADANYTVNAGQNVVIQAGAKITLMVGGSTLTITSAEIAAMAGKINLNS
ncbi:hypothetical protein HZF02_32710 (plasmid) [Pseudomonas yamanorum]|nr:hypothetical protein HZF02_32710 [Pseudomonas yamanorum]